LRESRKFIGDIFCAVQIITVRIFKTSTSREIKKFGGDVIADEKTESKIL